MAEALSDPRTYFKFTSCSRCLYKPCDALRFGGVRAGKFIIVHNSHLGTGFFDCPFVAQDFDEIRELLDEITFEDLVDRLDDVLFMFTPAESVQWRQEDFFSDFGDIAGRVEFLKALWDDGVISVVRIPRFFMTDAVMRKWLYAYEGLIYMLKKPELADDLTNAAVTDAMAGATTKTGGQDASDKKQAEKQESLSDSSVKKLIQLNDEHGNPVPGANYQIFVDNTIIAQGKLDASGKAEVEIKTNKGFSVKFISI
jgi:hypothetical protein